MDEFEKVNDTLENEEIKTEEVTLEADKDDAPEAVVEDIAETEEFTEAEDNTEALEETEVVAESFGISELEEIGVKAPQKQFIIERTIIKAGCIFLATLIVFCCVVIVQNVLTPGIEGVWRLDRIYNDGDESNAQKYGSSAKEANYFDFASDGNLTIVTGTVSEFAKWSYDDDKDGNYIKIFSESNEQNATQCAYSIDGNSFSKSKLKLEIGTGMVQVYEFSYYDSSDVPEYKMESDKSFKAVDELVGKWEDSTGQKIEFNKDGSYVLSSNLTKTTGIYSVDTKGKTVALKYVGNGQEMVMGGGPFPYTVKDDKMTLSYFEFTKK